MKLTNFSIGDHMVIEAVLTNGRTTKNSIIFQYLPKGGDYGKEWIEYQVRASQLLTKLKIGEVPLQAEGKKAIELFKEFQKANRGEWTNQTVKRTLSGEFSNKGCKLTLNITNQSYQWEQDQKEMIEKLKENGEYYKVELNVTKKALVMNESSCNLKQVTYLHKSVLGEAVISLPINKGDKQSKKIGETTIYNLIEELDKAQEKRFDESTDDTLDLVDINCGLCHMDLITGHTFIEATFIITKI